MSYSKISRKKLTEEFGIGFRSRSLFSDDISQVIPSERLVLDLKEGIRHGLKNEKALSEFLIIPILKEVWRVTGEQFKIHSGENLDVDVQQGLSGPCDFILSADPEDYEINAPIIAIVEAKKENFDAGITQGAAQLYAAMIFNERKGIPTPYLWGCSANGYSWQFFQVRKEKVVIVHPPLFSEENLPRLLGAWKLVIDESLAMVGKGVTV